ncbi:hypothetical protein CDCA_CDCA05G1672 [Cyanidium caldarium]|uniref:Phosphoglycerate mutase n=1 Tax=Cyanidium caldarium TaxID=2771 RepID=A0AAV9ITK0_CYACA|nr:hypothetical protein CDCA_CDCA05G1672 [Cyanidium caldarium]
MLITEGLLRLLTNVAQAHRVVYVPPTPAPTPAASSSSGSSGGSGGTTGSKTARPSTTATACKTLERHRACEPHSPWLLFLTPSVRERVIRQILAGVPLAVDASQRTCQPRPRLIIMRHARAVSWDQAAASATDSGASGFDRDRPLSARGQRDVVGIVAQLARSLGVEWWPPDVAVVSSATRARQTWSAVQAVLPSGEQQRVRVTYSDVLFTAERDQQLLELLHSSLQQLRAEERVLMMVGHNPTLERLLQALCGQSVALSSGSCALLEAIDGTAMGVIAGSSTTTEAAASGDHIAGSARPTGVPRWRLVDIIGAR